MQKTLMTLALTASIACFGSGLASAQATPQSPGTEAAPTAATNRNAQGGQLEHRDMRIEADAKACLDLKGARERECLKQAEGSYAKAIAAANRKTPDTANAAALPGGPLPALQTQSSSVTATGIAPSTAGPDLTPGIRATPAK
jgi:hypothetical protein